jgi:PTH1 family peptidyl-tRNA hydrolase
MKFLIVGLGNIGAEYELTRHNVGFMVVDHLADEAGVSFQSARLANVADFKHKGKSIYLIKPTTYMNLSGKAVNYWLKELKIPVEHALFVVDDIALPLEKLRMKAKGSSAGHNGLKHIEETIGAIYPRLRIGIGDNFSKGKQVDYVLSRFTEKEFEILPSILDNASKAALSFCTIGIERTMNFFNN